jgi:ribosomal protein S18 acetylase RimI-like enzyme
MSKRDYGAKPAVLRCTRCGKFVDWEDARLQIICGCRAHLNLPPVMTRQAQPEDHRAVMDLIEHDFGHTSVLVNGEVLRLEDAPAIVAEMKGEIAGALAYRLLPESLHIVALATHPMWQRFGVGGYLVAEAELLARENQRERVDVGTTNDNLPALYFYQRRGYKLTELILDGYRRHIPTPLTGFGGIPVRDEIRLSKRLQ